MLNDNPAAQAKPDKFMTIRVDTARVIESWRHSMFGFRWIDENGAIKPFEALDKAEQDKRRLVEDAIDNKSEIDKPVLGLGLKDNVEIGSGRAAFLTLSALGLNVIEVHIPKSNLEDFKGFIADD